MTTIGTGDLASADAQWTASAVKYASDDPAGFPGWFDALGAEDRAKLLRDPSLQAWHEGRGTAGAATAPTASDVSVADGINEQFVKALEEKTDATWEVGGFLVLLGDGHGGGADLARQQADHAYGTFQVERATFGAGKLVFTGAPPSHQATISEAVGRFSDKSVKFE